MDEIRNDIVRILEMFSGVPAPKIEDEMKLKKDLQLNDTALNFLTISLRGYIKCKASDPKKTILAKEIKKKDFTVGKLVALVKERIES